jgi:hypothetical protein
MIPEEDTNDSNQSPTEELESVTRGIKAIVDLLFQTLDDRLAVVAIAFEEILHQRIKTIRSEETVFQEAWATQQLALIRERLSGLQATLPDELRAQLGREIVSDHQAEIDERIREATETIVREAEATIDQELPAVTAYRFGQKMADSILSQPTSRTFHNWVTSLHGGQLVMLLSPILATSFALGLAGIIAWMGAVRTDVVWLLLVGSALLAFFDVYALWIWFGARADAGDDDQSQFRRTKKGNPA